MINENIKPNYYEVKAVSRSFLDAIDNNEDLSNRQVKASEALYFGTIFHSIMEGIRVLSDFVVVDEPVLNAYEKKIYRTPDMFEKYFQVYENETTRKAAQGDIKSIEKIQTIVDELKSRTASYFESVKMYHDMGKTVLNEIDVVGNAKEFYDTLVKCVTSIENNESYNQLIFDIEDKECEVDVYDDYQGIPVKVRLDVRCKKNGKMINIDYKTYDRGKEKSIIEHKYIRQQSFYNYFAECEESYLVMVSKRTGKVSIVKLNFDMLRKGQYGGYIKPEFYDYYNTDNEFEPYLDEFQLGWLVSNRIWSGLKNKYYVRGWKELMDIVIKNNLYERYIANR